LLPARSGGSANPQALVNALAIAARMGQH